jgi:nucleoside-diphosphate-sugar epimerase
LRTLGVEFAEGDLTDFSACDRANRGVRHVYHAAAKVGDWGTWTEFQTGCLDASENLAKAAIKNQVARFIHISSTSAYGHPREDGLPIDESAPLGQNLWAVWDNYTRSKVESERMLWRLVETDHLPLTVIRPSWLFGERDRTTTARLVSKLQRGGIPLLGKGDNPLSAIHAGCVAEAAILAANHPLALNQAFNITDQGPITQKEYFTLWAESVGVPPSLRRLKYPLVFSAAHGFEARARRWLCPTPPLITRYAAWLMGRNLAYSTLKARETLGWTPSEGYRESISRTVAWYLGRNVENEQVRNPQPA